LTESVPDAAQGSADIYLLNGTPCSAGTGPGYATVPFGEARALVAQGLAAWGTQPPHGLWAGQPVSPP
jgi:hypothetical protein